MDLKTHQRAAMDGLFVKPDVEVLPHLALGLAGEAGEVADQIKKSQYEGRSLDVLKLLNEAGDTLWYLQVLVGRLGYTLEEIASMNIEKLAQRHPDLYGQYLIHPDDRPREIEVGVVVSATELAHEGLCLVHRIAEQHNPGYVVRRLIESMQNPATHNITYRLTMVAV